MNIKEVEISQRQGEFLKDFLKKDTKIYILGINKYSDSLYCGLIEKGLHYGLAKIASFILDTTGPVWLKA